jgi:hypothetical protein
MKQKERTKVRENLREIIIMINDFVINHTSFKRFIIGKYSQSILCFMSNH